MRADIIYKPNTERPPEDSFTSYDEKREIVVSIIKKLDHVTLLCDIKGYKYSQLTEFVRKAHADELAGIKPVKEEKKAEPVVPKFRDDLPVNNTPRPAAPVADKKGKKKSKPNTNQGSLL